jgi:ketosteroid isomerase-like protein
MAKTPTFKNSDAAYAKAFNAGDVAQVVALHSADVILMMPETRAYKGAKWVRSLVQTAINAGWRNMKFKTLKSGSDGNLAFTIGSVSTDRPSGGGRARVKGKYLDVYRRQRDGSWKIIATMYSTDKPAK